MMHKKHQIEVYVRFSETDAVGHVNNTSYFLYFEEARTKLFYEILPNRNKQSSMILASIHCDYVAPAFAGEELVVTTEVSNIGRKSFELQHLLTRKMDGKLVAKASCVTVCYNFIDDHSILIPEHLRDNLKKYQPLALLSKTEEGVHDF